MKNLRNTVLVFASLISSIGFAQEYTINSNNSSVEWHATKVTGEHYGTINFKSGSFTIENNIISSGEFVIDMTSIENSDLEGEWNAKLVGHLKSDDFFGVAKYPTAKLVITESSEFKSGVADVKANLSIKGKTHPVSFKVKKDGDSFSTTLSVDRTLYNIRYGSGKFFDGLGDKMIYDEFSLKVQIN